MRDVKIAAEGIGDGVLLALTMLWVEGDIVLQEDSGQLLGYMVVFGLLVGVEVGLV